MSYARTKRDRWVTVATYLTYLHIMFAMLLIGITGISRVGVLTSLLLVLWCFVGFMKGVFKFPAVLLLPMLWLLFIIFYGYFSEVYPVNFISRSLTAWIGAIALAAIVANGMSLDVILRGFALVFLGNMLAIAFGYDAFLIYQTERYEDWQIEGFYRNRRYTGFAGQANLLVSLCITPLFFLFLRKQKISMLLFIALCLSGLLVASLTGSRSTFVFIGWFGIAGWFFLVDRFHTKRFVDVLVVLVATALVVVGSSKSARTLVISGLNDSIAGDLLIVKRLERANEDVDRSSDTRTELKEDAWDSFRRQPWLGHGVDAFRDMNQYGMYAHATFPELAATVGVVGMSIYLLMYLVPLRRMLRRRYLILGLVPLIYIVLANQWFVSQTNRPQVLLMCLLLVYSVGRLSSVESRK